MFTYQQLYFSTVNKEYLKNNIKYLQVLILNKNNNKVVVVNISYKRYLLQQYLGYLIPKEYRVVHLDGDINNFDVYNLGIRDENNESPIYKGWKIVSIRPKAKDRIDKVITIVGSSSKQLPYHHYLYAIYLGREILFDEIFIFKDGDRTHLKISNFTLKRYPIIPSKVYPDCEVRGIYGSGRKLYVRIKNQNNDDEQKLAYSRFLYQEYIGKELQNDEYIVMKEPNNFDITNMILKRTHTFSSKLYENVKIITGPYFKKRGRNIDEEYERQRVRISFNDNKYIDISYPKFILQEHLGRLLNNDETVHHKDGDYYNNEIDNLEILGRSEHAKRDAIRLKTPTIICQVCNKEFVLQNDKFNRECKKFKVQKDQYIGPFCNINCTINAKKAPEKYFNLLPEKEYSNLSQTYEGDL